MAINTSTNQYIVIGINPGYHTRLSSGYGTKVFGTGTRKEMLALKKAVNIYAKKRPYGSSWQPAIIKKITPLKHVTPETL